MSLKPWDPGYVAPAPKTPEEVAAERAANSALGGLNRGENRKRARKGEPPQYGEKTTRSLDPTKGTRNKPDPNTPTSKRIAKKTEDRLKPAEINMVNEFVRHYLRSFDAPMAYVMAGGNPSSATVTAYEILRWPAVQERMAIALEELEEEQLLTRKDILVGLKKEANYHGHDSSHGSRVRAWMGLARIKKMDIQVTENHHTVRGGVMLIPVADHTNTIDGWAQVVSEDQARLKEEVRK